MNESAQSAIDNVMSGMVLFVVLMVISYIAIKCLNINISIFCSIA